MSFKKCRDFVVGIVMLVFSGLYLFFTQQVRTRPKLTPAYANARIVPTLLGVLLAILAVIVLIEGIMKMKKAKDEDAKPGAKGDVMAVVLTFAVIIGYIMILPELGFCLSTVVFLFLQMLILAPKDKRNYWLFALVAVIFTAVVFVAFRIGLQQMLPRGIIENLLGF